MTELDTPREAMSQPLTSRRAFFQALLGGGAALALAPALAALYRPPAGPSLIPQRTLDQSGRRWITGRSRIAPGRTWVFFENPRWLRTPPAVFVMVRHLVAPQPVPLVILHTGRSGFQIGPAAERLPCTGMEVDWWAFEEAPGGMIVPNTAAGTPGGDAILNRLRVAPRT